MTETETHGSVGDSGKEIAPTCHTLLKPDLHSLLCSLPLLCLSLPVPSSRTRSPSPILPFALLVFLSSIRASCLRTSCDGGLQPKCEEGGRRSVTAQHLQSSWSELPVRAMQIACQPACHPASQPSRLLAGHAASQPVRQRFAWHQDSFSHSRGGAWAFLHPHGKSRRKISSQPTFAIVMEVRGCRSDGRGSNGGG